MGKKEVCHRMCPNMSWFCLKMNVLTPLGIPVLFFYSLRPFHLASHLKASQSPSHLTLLAQLPNFTMKNSSEAKPCTIFLKEHCPDKRINVYLWPKSREKKWTPPQKIRPLKHLLALSSNFPLTAQKNYRSPPPKNPKTSLPYIFYPS